MAQIASTFFENTPRTYVRKVENEEDGTFTYEEVSNPDPSDKNIHLTSGDLLFYGDDYVEENGVARKATAKEIADGVSKKANFMEVYLPAIFKDTQGNMITDFSKIDPELLKVFGYRIPTQEMSSMESIRIKGFLPLEYQNGIVVPSSITAKAGSDFDIDKLNVYFKNVYLDKDGKPRCYREKKSNLKTGIYYLRNKGATDAVKFTIQEEQKKSVEEQMAEISCSLDNPDDCLACGS